MAFSASFFLMLMTGRVFQKRLGGAVLDHAVGVSLFIADAAAEPGRSAALALLLAVGGDHSVKRPLPLPLQKFFGYAAVQEIPGENLVKTPLPGGVKAHVETALFKAVIQISLWKCSPQES